MTTTAPIASGRAIALAHYAGRALLERALAKHGLTFEQSVTLRGVVVAGGVVGRDELVGEIAGGLKVEGAVVRGVIGEMAAGGLVAEEEGAGRVTVTEAGREVYEMTTREAAGISARLYAGISVEELAVAGRVLALVTERANAELGGV
jgi:DNA-binding MarR family transcriptional regulator